MVLASGEGDKLYQGLYDNYLEAKVKDPHLEGVGTGLFLSTGLVCHCTSTDPVTLGKKSHYAPGNHDASHF